MELNDTVKGMTSADYKERMAAEYRQVKIRHDKLETFCDKIEAAQITGESPRSTTALSACCGTSSASWRNIFTSCGCAP